MVRAVYSLACLMWLMCAAVESRAAILQVEDFASDPGLGWDSRDSEMLVDWTNTEGNPSGSIEGSFEAQDVPFFESDAIRITDADWTGDYTVNFPSFTQFTFDFLAQDVLPSTFIVRISDGVTTFMRNLLPQVLVAGVWNTDISVALAYDAGWLGGNAVQFDGVMQNVSFIDLQIGRNGAGSQQYYVDNLELLDDPLDGGGGGDPLSAVPEPFALNLLAMGGCILYAFRRRLRTA